MKYVVLGSSGFIGRRFCEMASERGDVVRLIPRDMYGNVFALRNYLELEQPDHIVNFSAYGNHNIQTDIHAIYEANLTNSIHLLEATKNISYTTLILVGSSSEYGTVDQPMKETMLPLTDTFYGASKVAQTYLARAYAHTFDKPIAVVRPFSVYGPGEADFRFIPTIIRSLVDDTSFKLVAKPAHDWIYLDDFVRGVFQVCAHPEHVYGQPINIGTGLCTDNLTIVHMLEEIARKKARFEEIETLRNYDSELWVADTKYSSSMFKIEPTVDLYEGLKRTYEHYS